MKKKTKWGVIICASVVAIILAVYVIPWCADYDFGLPDNYYICKH